MHPHCISRATFGLLSLLIFLGLAVLIQPSHGPILSQVVTAGVTGEQQVMEVYGKLPLYFIENQGQLDPRVAYYIQGGDKSIYFTGSGVTFLLTAALTAAGDEEPAAEALVHPASYRGTGLARELGPQREAQSWERQR